MPCATCSRRPRAERQFEAWPRQRLSVLLQNRAPCGIVDHGLTVHVSCNDVVAQRGKPASREIHPAQGAAIRGDLVLMSGVMAAFVIADEALEMTRRIGVARVIDNLRPVRGAIIGRFSEEAARMARAGAVDLLHRLALARHPVRAGTGRDRDVGRGAKREDQGGCIQPHGPHASAGELFRC